MNKPHGSPEWVIEFARAVCPESPDLLLSTNERNILTAATQKILDLKAELTQLRTERNRLRVTLRRVCSHEEAWDRLPMSLQDEAAAALTQREGGEE